MTNVTASARGLTPAQVEGFITSGFVRLDHAFPRELADAARAILWKASGCSPNDPATWTRPWSAEVLWKKTTGPIFEHACHEGNYSLFNILSGARAGEKRAAEEAAKKEPPK